MNLAFDSWIPVVTTTGERRVASLTEVLDGGDGLVDLAVRPHERVALMRLLICVAQAALDGPASDYDPPEATMARLPGAARGYLEKWRDDFELFHPQRPFLQRADITKPAKSNKKGADAEPDLTPTSKLDFALATGANTTLFDHGGAGGHPRAFTPAQLALTLLTFQNFSPGGTIAQVFWRGVQSSKSSNHAPCTPGAMLHGFVRRENLYASICANLLSKALVSRIYGKADAWGIPIWERPPANGTDTPAIANATSTYLGRLVPMSRLIRLDSDGDFMMLGNGLEYPSYGKGGMREPSATEVAKKDGTGRALLGARDKAVWRELHSLSLARRNDVGGALTLLNVLDNASFDYWLGAFITNQNAAVVDVVESVFHVPARMLGEPGHHAYRDGVEYAERVAGHLNWAVEIYRQQVDGGWQGRLKMAGPKKWDLLRQLHANAARHYWTTLETRRELLLRHVELFGSEDGLEAISSWRAVTHVAARAAYRLVCGMDTPRQVRAFALGWDNLTLPVDKDGSGAEPVRAMTDMTPQEEEY
ncbi:MAG: type I-E CRISPR-associated protein Cse1/CasA [Gemmatimonadaceae bacterium]